MATCGVFDPDLLAQIKTVLATGSTVYTLGYGKPNVIGRIDSNGIEVTAGRSGGHIEVSLRSSADRLASHAQQVTSSSPWTSGLEGSLRSNHRPFTRMLEPSKPHSGSFELPSAATARTGSSLSLK